MQRERVVQRERLLQGERVVKRASGREDSGALAAVHRRVGDGVEGRQFVGDAAVLAALDDAVVLHALRDVGERRTGGSPL